MKASPALMEQVGSAIKAGYAIYKNPTILEQLDLSEVAWGKATNMAREMGLPFLHDDDEPSTRVLWATIYVEKVFGIEMPDMVFEGDRLYFETAV